MNKEYFTSKEFRIISAFAIINLVVHLYTNIFAGYGIFRDELYYIACANRPGFGYVDQPPFSILFLTVSKFILGDSVFAIRLIPSIVSSIVILIGGMITNEFGGKKTAHYFTGLAFITAPLFWGVNIIYSMNTFDYLFWISAFYLIVRIINTGNEKLWIYLGVIIGLGLMNKIGFLWFGGGLFVGLILTKQRIFLKSKYPYLAAGIAFLIFLPFIIWNLTHDFAHIEFMRNALQLKYSGITRIDFLKGILLSENPVNIVIWLSGLYYFFINKNGRKYTLLGFIFVTVFLILLINGHSKSEYIGPALVIVFSAGGVMLENIFQLRYLKWMKYIISIPSILIGIVSLPLALPIMPVETYINYSSALGFGPSTSENKELAELPQFYADMFGWEQLAKDVSEVYQSIPNEEKPFTVVYCSNYGKAGAIEYYSDKYSLPKVVCPHNSYWYWWNEIDLEKVRNVIVIGGNPDDHYKSCNIVEPVKVHNAKYSMPYENNITIYICKDLIRNLNQIHESDKNFE